LIISYDSFRTDIIVLRSTISSEESSSIHSEFMDIVSAAAEVSHTQAAKLFSQRAELHSKLDLPEFGEIFNESWSFVVQCEVLCKRMIVSLRGVIVSQVIVAIQQSVFRSNLSQAKQFLQNFHQSRLSQSAKLVEDEQWSPQEVTASLQDVITVIVDCAVRDSPALKFGALASLSDASSSSGSTKHLRIEERAYFTVPATSQVLNLLLDYVKVIVNLGMLTMDTMSRVMEFLKAFNSRTCQVVLGAGAMRSAGLKNITAKHLGTFAFTTLLHRTRPEC
jgi:vacuolar protein sorting-associated protein 54